jgi:segregation and condensation protein A
MEHGEFQVKTPSFEGPLDLLLHLARQRKVDIKDISLSDITDEYIDHVREIGELDLESASEFIVLAATLLQIKARMLLPAQAPQASCEDLLDNDDVDAGEILKARLILYERIKEASLRLREKESVGRKRYGRGRVYPEAAILEPDPGFPQGFDLESLREVYQNLVLRSKRTVPPPPLPSRRKSFTARFREVIAFLKRKWGTPSVKSENLKRSVEFWEIVGKNQKGTRTDVVLTLLVVLEIVRKGFAKVCEARPLEGFSLVHGPIFAGQGRGRGPRSKGIT